MVRVSSISVSETTSHGFILGLMEGGKSTLELRSERIYCGKLGLTQYKTNNHYYCLSGRPWYLHLLLVTSQPRPEGPLIVSQVTSSLDRKTEM